MSRSPAGERIGVGDRVATRRNDRDLGVANRDTWTVTRPRRRRQPRRSTGRNGQRSLPAAYVREHVELAYATTVYGAQGETVDRAHFVVGENTGAAAAYVAMTRGRHANTAHLVAENLDDARSSGSRSSAATAPTSARPRRHPRRRRHRPLRTTSTSPLEHPPSRSPQPEAQGGAAASQRPLSDTPRPARRRAGTASGSDPPPSNRRETTAALVIEER